MKSAILLLGVFVLFALCESAANHDSGSEMSNDNDHNLEQPDDHFNHDTGSDLTDEHSINKRSPKDLKMDSADEEMGGKGKSKDKKGRKVDDKDEVEEDGEVKGKDKGKGKGRAKEDQ